MIRKKEITFREVANWDEPNRCIILIRRMCTFCVKSSKSKYIVTALYFALSILIGTLIVWLTSPRPKYICQRIHRQTVMDIKTYRSRPQSVAVDRFNNDDLLDFVVVNTGLDTIDIYLGQSNGTFRHHTTYSTGFHSQPRSAAVGNLDNHGGSDIAVANFATNCIMIFMGSNNGFFTFNQSVPTNSSRPLMIALADLNDDHWLDLVVLNYGTDSVGIYVSSKSGFFTFLKNYHTEYDSLPKSLAIADLNNDNHFDIVVANSGTNNVGIFLGNGNGTFADQTIYSTGIGSNPSSVAVGDVNHDGYLDIIVANYATNDIEIFLGDLNENFTRRATYSTGMNSHPEYVAVYDFNGDDHLDIIAVDSGNNRIYIFPGEENGIFPLLSMYITDLNSSPIGIAGGDFDNDNRTDALIVNRDANSILLLMKYDIKSSASYSEFAMESFNYPMGIETGDLNNDNILDIVVINKNSSVVHVLLGYGNGSFRLVGNISTGFNCGIKDIILRYLNNDRQLDMVVLSDCDNSFNILLGYGDGTFSAIIRHPTNTVLDPLSFAINDINHDNCLDIVVIGGISAKIGVWIGFCNGTFEMVAIYDIESDWKPSLVFIDDFDNDSNRDFLVTSRSNSSIMFFFGIGNGQFSTHKLHLTKTSNIWYVMDLGDLNNDNRTDMVAAVGTSNIVTVLIGYGNGSFENEKMYFMETCYFAGGIIIADFNIDGESDLVLSCPFSDRITILFGDGTGEFPSQTTYPTEQNSPPFGLTSGDFNNDGRVDIAFVQSTDDTIGILMGYYKADFTVQSEYSTGFSPQPYSVAISDFNHDNISDMAVVNSGTKNVNIRLGFGNGSFGIETAYPTGENSFAQHINVGDLNEDDNVDIVIVDSNNDRIMIFLGRDDGTFGNTLTYFVDLQSHPTWVVISDMNNDKRLDLVVANHDADSLGIFYSYNYATFTLHQTYPTGYDSSPRVITVGDINNDNQLDIIVANELSNNIGVFLADGNGYFAPQITYSLGNDSYPTAVAVGDMNKDGHLDIIVGSIGGNSLGILLGNDNSTYEIMIKHFIGANFAPFDIAVEDINNDNQLDVIIADYERDKLEVFLGFGNGSLSHITTHSTDPDFKPVSIDLGDLNNDSFLDIVVVHSLTDSIGVLLGYGNGSFILQTIYRFRRGSNSWSVVLADLNNDHQLDIAVSNPSYQCVEILTGYGNGNFSTSKPYSLDQWSIPSDLIVDYFNNDSLLDIAVISDGSSSFSILFGTDDGSFLLGRKTFTSSSSLFKTMASADFNNDSQLDLVVANRRGSSIDVFLGNGNEFFATPVIISTDSGSKPHSLAVDDFDHDNRSDIVVANSGADNITIILATQLDSGTNFTTYSTGSGSRPHVLVVGDFNDDNHPDIAVLNFGHNSVIIFRGYNDGSFLAIGTYSTGSRSAPRSIAVADFNNDQKMDLAIANAGANNVVILFGFGNGTFGNETSISMGYDSRPYSVAVGDFDRDGWMDMAVANFGADYVEILLQPC